MGLFNRSFSCNDCGLERCDRRGGSSLCMQVVIHLTLRYCFGLGKRSVASDVLLCLCVLRLSLDNLSLRFPQLSLALVERCLEWAWINLEQQLTLVNH